MAKVIGIDLGTTNSVVSVFDDGESRILENVTGGRTTPSIVAIDSDGKLVVGEAARSQQVLNPRQTIYSIKRFMGRRHNEVQSEEKIVPYDVVGKPEEFVGVQIGKRRMTPQQISAVILRHLRGMAEAQLGEPVERAVITVPAYFNDSQRQATMDAATIAGLKVERIINEPTAAAIAYGLEKRAHKKVVVVDFGGGTLDLSALEIGDRTFKVLSVHGNSHLGGDDFDQRIIDVVADDFRRKEQVELRDDPMALQRLKEGAAIAKAELSNRAETTINLPFIMVDGKGPRHLQYTLEREAFESLCVDLFDEFRDCCRQMRIEATSGGGPIGAVVMVGGSSRIPRIQSIAREAFGVEELDRSINPDEVVALGAGTLAGVIQGDLTNLELMDVTTHSLGVENAEGGFDKLIVRNTPIPATVAKVFTTPRDGQTTVDVRILDGESDTATDNRTVGVVRLRGIAKARAGVPKIEVKFAIDADGILQVSATDQATGRSHSCLFDDAVGLDKTELERMRAEAEVAEHREQEFRAIVDLRNHAEEVMHDLSKWLEYNGRMMPPKAREQIKAGLSKLGKKIEKNDKVGIKTALKKLDGVVLPLRKSG